MIEFKNEKQINEYMAMTEIHLVMLKARIECEKIQCRIADKSTDAFIHKGEAIGPIEHLQNSVSMVEQYLK